MFALNFRAFAFKLKVLLEFFLLSLMVLFFRREEGQLISRTTDLLVKFLQFGSQGRIFG